MKTLITTIAVVLLAITVFAEPNNDAAPTVDLTGVQADLNKGVDVNAKDVDGKTPLIGHQSQAQRNLRTIRETRREIWQLKNNPDHHQDS